MPFNSNPNVSELQFAADGTGTLQVELNSGISLARRDFKPELFVGGLPIDEIEDSYLAFFRQFNCLKSCKLFKEIMTCYAFVYFESVSLALDAMARFNGSSFCQSQRRVVVKWSRESLRQMQEIQRQPPALDDFPNVAAVKLMPLDNWLLGEQNNNAKTRVRLIMDEDGQLQLKQQINFDIIQECSYPDGSADGAADPLRSDAEASGPDSSLESMGLQVELPDGFAARSPHIAIFPEERPGREEGGALQSDLDRGWRGLETNGCAAASEEAPESLENQQKAEHAFKTVPLRDGSLDLDCMMRGVLRRPDGKPTSNSFTTKVAIGSQLPAFLDGDETAVENLHHGPDVASPSNEILLPSIMHTHNLLDMSITTLENLSSRDPPFNPGEVTTSDGTAELLGSFGTSGGPAGTSAGQQKSVDGAGQLQARLNFVAEKDHSVLQGSAGEGHSVNILDMKVSDLEGRCHKEQTTPTSMTDSEQEKAAQSLGLDLLLLGDLDQPAKNPFSSSSSSEDEDLYSASITFPSESHQTLPKPPSPCQQRSSDASLDGIDSTKMPSLSNEQSHLAKLLQDLSNFYPEGELESLPHDYSPSQLSAIVSDKKAATPKKDTGRSNDDAINCFPIASDVGNGRPSSEASSVGAGFPRLRLQGKPLPTPPSSLRLADMRVSETASQEVADRVGNAKLSGGCSCDDPVELMVSENRQLNQCGADALLRHGKATQLRDAAGRNFSKLLGLEMEKEEQQRKQEEERRKQEEERRKQEEERRKQEEEQRKQEEEQRKQEEEQRKQEEERVRKFEEKKRIIEELQREREMEEERRRMGGREDEERQRREEERQRREEERKTRLLGGNEVKEGRMRATSNVTIDEDQQLPWLDEWFYEKLIELCYRSSFEAPTGKITCCGGRIYHQTYISVILDEDGLERITKDLMQIPPETKQELSNTQCSAVGCTYKNNICTRALVFGKFVYLLDVGTFVLRSKFRVFRLPKQQLMALPPCSRVFFYTGPALAKDARIKQRRLVLHRDESSFHRCTTSIHQFLAPVDAIEFLDDEMNENSQLLCS